MPPSEREGDRAYAVEGANGMNDLWLQYCYQINIAHALSSTRPTAGAPSRREPLIGIVHPDCTRAEHTVKSQFIRLHARCEHEERSKSMFATQTWCGAKRNLAADSNFNLCCPYLNACVRAGVEKINAIIKLFPFSEKFLPSFFQKARRRRHASSPINPNLYYCKIVTFVVKRGLQAPHIIEWS